MNPPLPDRGRLYVIGDIHGRSDLLDRMIGEIAADLAARPVADSLVVTVGDYFDRGPDSRGVIERLRSNPFPTDYVPLKGNHEVLLEAFLTDPNTAAHWRRLGGLETLQSYGVPVDQVMRGGDYIGLGIGAASRFGTEVVNNPRNFEKYREMVAGGAPAFEPASRTVAPNSPPADIFLRMRTRLGMLLTAPGNTSQTPTVPTVSTDPVERAADSTARAISAAARNASRRPGMRTAPACPPSPSI